MRLCLNSERHRTLDSSSKYVVFNTFTNSFNAEVFHCWEKRLNERRELGTVYGVTSVRDYGWTGLRVYRMYGRRLYG